MSDEETRENTETAEAVETPETTATEAHEHHHHHDENEEDKFTFVEDPVFDVAYKGECRYEVGVTIPAANEKAQCGKLMDKLQSEVELKGFRRGRAPRKLVEKKFGKAVRGDATEKIVTAAYEKLITDNAFKPIGTPDMEGLENVLDRPEEEPLTFTVKFEVFPKCELGKYRGVEVERPVLKVTDTEIDAALEEVRKRYAMYETVADAEAQDGDQVVIDFKGAIDGADFPGNHADNYPYILGSKRFFPEFEAVIIGAKAGDERQCAVTFPEDYFNKDIAGKTAEFVITVREIKRRQMPELNDEFAKMAGADDLAALREKTTEDLRKELDNMVSRIVEERALKIIVESSTFELPKSLVESSANEYYEQEVRRLAQLRMPRAEIDAMEEQLRAKASETAEYGIKSLVVLQEIAATEGLEVTEEDFEHEVETLMARTGADINVVNRFLSQEENYNDYAHRILRRKAIAVVTENAAYTDKEVTRETLEQEGNEENQQDAS